MFLPGQGNDQFIHRGVAVERHILILDVTPQTFDKNVVKSPAPAIHADGDVFALEHSRKGQTGELSTLVAVEYVRLAVGAQSLLQTVYTEAGIHAES